MDEKVITDPREIAQQLNRFFSGIGQSLAEKIPLSERKPEDFMGPSVANSFALIPTTSYEIIQLAKSSKYTRSKTPLTIYQTAGTFPSPDANAGMHRTHTNTQRVMSKVQTTIHAYEAWHTNKLCT